MSTNTIISIRGLTKTFLSNKNTVTALRNIDLDIKKGDIFGIIGVSGAGKSTLVRCINLLKGPIQAPSSLMEGI